MDNSSAHDVDQARAFLKVGGRATGERPEYPEGTVVVVQDPEGNEFCIVLTNRRATPIADTR
ncbi:VOC family protein [Mycobacteroides abscessus]|uniref:VOC family protein n=1 Tax=Mycobacteroides abscessus TaxID=36809 RepID=UPI00373FD938